jgi:asparagine synthase (glutamine-hydrolysing)
MKDKLPQAVLQRKKQGFNVPNARWIKQGLRSFVMDHLSSSRLREMGWFDERVVAALLQNHFSGRADNSHQIWCLLTLSLWWQQFIQGESKG